MIGSIKQLDRILRGEATQPELLREGGIRVPVFGLIVLLVLLGALYGVCMGVYSITGSGNGDPRQIVAAAFKVPSLFLLTLLVTLPSLYVFNALIGSRLTLPALIRLMVCAMGVTMAVLASIGPIVAFFSFSTTSYPFINLLNVFVFAVAGFLGLIFLKQTLHRLAVSQMPAVASPSPMPTQDEIRNEQGEVIGIISRPPAAIDRIENQVFGKHTRRVFTIWMFVFGLVGSQMAWILRPFIGTPGQAFTWFRPRGSNFFESVWTQLQHLFGG